MQYFQVMQIAEKEDNIISALILSALILFVISSLIKLWY